MLGERVKMLRKRNDLTLSELADRSNISKSYLSNIERNINQNPSIKLLKRLSRELKVDYRFLVDSRVEVQLEQEWLDFISRLKEAGVSKYELEDMKGIIEYYKWKKHVENEQQ